MGIDMGVGIEGWNCASICWGTVTQSTGRRSEKNDNLFDAATKAANIVLAWAKLHPYPNTHTRRQACLSVIPPSLESL